MSLSDLSRYNLTTEQLAGKLGYHPQHVRLLASKGKLPAIKRGRAWRFNEEEVLNFLKQQGVNNGPSGDPKVSDMLR